jgi:hypothetical protein
MKLYLAITVTPFEHVTKAVSSGIYTSLEDAKRGVEAMCDMSKDDPHAVWHELAKGEWGFWFDGDCDTVIHEREV